MNMTKALFTIGLIAVITWGFQKMSPPKTYAVSKSLDEWQRDFDTLSEIQVNIGYAKSKAEGDYYQAALGRLMQRLRQPLIVQIQEEQKKATDTVKPKTK
jgi:hypothetical protein